MDQKNPFLRYTPKVYSKILEQFVDKKITENDEYLAVPQILNPSVSYTEGETGLELIAQIGDYSLPIYTAYDLLSWQAKNSKDTKNHFQGLIGERILSLSLEFLVSELGKEFSGAEFGAIREAKKYRGKKMISRFNDQYLLKFNGTTSFVILSKTNHDPFSVREFEQEKFGMTASEIDALAYFFYNGNRYVIVGESSTRNNSQLSLNSWKKETNYDCIRHLFDPLRSLFPETQIIYVTAAHDNLLYNHLDKPSKLKGKPKEMHDVLEEQGILSIFIPFPENQRTIRDLASDAVHKHKFIMGISKRKFI